MPLLNEAKGSEIVGETEPSSAMELFAPTSTPENVKYHELLSEWYFIPFPNAPSLIEDISRLWGDSKEIRSKSWGLEELVEKAISYAANGAFLKKTASSVSEPSIAQVRQVTAAINRDIEFFETYKLANEFASYKPHKRFGRVLYKIDSPRDLQVAGNEAVHLLRCLYAAIRNSMEHLTSFRVWAQHKILKEKLATEVKPCDSPIRCHVKVDFDDNSSEYEIEFSIVNQMKSLPKKSKQKRRLKSKGTKVGTEEVVKYALFPLHGEVTSFQRDAENDEVWVTRFTACLTMLNQRNS